MRTMLQTRQLLDGWVTASRFLRRFTFLWRKIVVINLCGVAESILQLSIPVASAALIDKAIPRKDTHLLIEISVALALATVGVVIIAYVEARIASVFRERAIVALETDLLEHVQAQPYQFFKQHESGYIMSRILNDASSTTDLLSSLTTGGKTLTILIGGLILLPSFDLSLGLFIVSILPIYLLLLIHFQWKTKQAFHSVSEKTAVTSKELFESLSGIYETKAYGAEKHRLRRYLKATSDRARLLIKARTLIAAGTQVTQVVTLLVSLSVIVYGGAQVIAGTLSLGNLIAINAVGAFLLGPINQIVRLSLGVQNSVAAVERIEEWLAMPCEDHGSASLTIRRVRGSISYKGISFGYRNRPLILTNINWEIYPGEVVLLTGPSGIGKTTLVNLLPRFLLPLSGDIFLDGVPISAIPTRFLRDSISFVSQDTFLFSESINSNIRLGKPSASDEDIYMAAAMANALEFIEALPNRFETEVGERGARLSGGQRQRIAIARAIIRDAPIIILDEATSAVDTETETAVHEAMCRLMKDRTTIIIAHHPTAFVERVSRCFSLEDGRLKEISTALAVSTEFKQPPMIKSLNC
jgi:ABC-type bacteriocin/lantibiotic exporter with double-glycine peptidase domain